MALTNDQLQRILFWGLVLAAAYGTWVEAGAAAFDGRRDLVLYYTLAGALLVAILVLLETVKRRLDQ